MEEQEWGPCPCKHEVREIPRKSPHRRLVGGPSMNFYLRAVKLMIWVKHYSYKLSQRWVCQYVKQICKTCGFVLLQVSCSVLCQF